MVLAWLAAGNAVTQPPAQTQAEARTERLEKLVNLHLRILALQRELSQDQTNATAINAMITAAQQKIENIRNN